MLVYLKKLNELIKGLPLNNNNINESIKTVCILSNRIVQKVFFDIETTYIDTKLEKYNNFWYIPNELKGLIDGKSVCRGMAGIFKDAMTMLGYQTLGIVGMDNQEGHAWNQIKIGTDWYNCDITWDRNNILNRSFPPCFLLTDDRTFYSNFYDDNGKKISHDGLTIGGNTFPQKASRCIDREIIMSYLYEEEKQKEKWLKDILSKTKRSGR